MKTLKRKGEFLKKLFSRERIPQVFLLTGEGKSREEWEGLFPKLLNCHEADLRRYEAPLFKIEDAHRLKESASKSAWGDSKVFLIKSVFLGPEAQAALLKIAEEPPARTYFVFSLPSGESVSPALFSRLYHIRAGFAEGPRETAILKKLEAGGAEKGLLEAALFGKERERGEEFLRAMEFWLADKIKHAPAGEFEPLRTFARDFFEIQKRFYAKTYAGRMLLEHLIVSRAYLK